MNNEARIGYLCHQAARDLLTVDELSELMTWIAVDPEIMLLIRIETKLYLMGKADT